MFLFSCKSSYYYACNLSYGAVCASILCHSAGSICFLVCYWISKLILPGIIARSVNMEGDAIFFFHLRAYPLRMLKGVYAKF